MKKTLYIRLLLLAAFALPVMLVFVACSDDEPEDIARIEYFEWYAAGSDVAPLFRAFPLKIDSIFLRFRVNIPNILNPDSVLYRIYMEKYTENSASPTVITGKDQPGWGAFYDPDTTAFDNIIMFRTRNAVENGSDLTITGIYKEFPGDDPPTMKMEYVYEKPGWPLPPTAEGRFGSTAEGAYGDNNVHLFTRILNEDQDEEND